jgi:RNA polymerase sigma-70 factor (ECF subfamily)
MTDAMSEIERRREFDALTRQLRPELYRYAFWLGRARQLAEDVVQETLLRAWRSWGDLRDPAAAKSWVIAIVRREHARTFERKRLETVDVADLEEQLEGPAEDPALLEMRRAIFRLEPEYREPLVLQVLMGYKAREIAELMETTSGAVLTRLHRARARLREAMGLAPVPDAGGGDGSSQAD